jgi:alpha-mannosidase
MRQRMAVEKLYVIPNAHLDPVWLWPWRDGYSEAHNTIKSALDRLEENPDLTFSCSASSVFEWIEESNPDLFRNVQKMVAENRFEIVGGWLVQSDTIIASGESLIMQAEFGKSYFKSKFKKDIEIAYSVDSFGQNSGLPKVLAYSGFKYYVFNRPGISEKTLPHVFWWEAGDGSRILTLRTVPHGYTTPGIMNRQEFIDLAKTSIENGDSDQTFFMGVGNHGGGPTIKQIEWVRELQEIYNVKFSTLLDYFKIIEKRTDIPVVKGELTHHAKGCYSTHSGIKKWINLCGIELYKAESLMALGRQNESSKDAWAMESAWWNCLFNHFHDILPGTSVEAAYEDARDSLGGAINAAGKIKIRELHRLAKQVDTSDFSEGGIFIYNPLPWPRKAAVEIDTFRDPNFTGSDFMSLKAPDGSVYPIQWNQAAVSFGPCLSKWGKLTALVDLPAMGYRSFSLEKTLAANDYFEAFKEIEWFRKISFEVIYDNRDAWAHGAEGRLGDVIGIATLVKSQTLEKGPVRSRFRAFYKYKKSSIALELTHYQNLECVQADIKVDWHETYHTLKFVLQTGIHEGLIASEQAYDIVERSPDDSEQPIQHFLAVTGTGKVMAVISDSCHAYDSFDSDKIRLTLLRAVPYSVHTDFAHGEEEIIDQGKSSFRFWFVESDNTQYSNWLPRLSQEMRYGCEYVMDSNHSGNMQKDSGDRLLLKPECLTIGRLYRENGIKLRTYNNSDKTVQCEIISEGAKFSEDICGSSIYSSRVISKS